MTIKSSTATVYFGGRRRYFTLAAAVRAEAREKINSRCDCVEGSSGRDWHSPPEACSYHADMVRWAKIMRRLERAYKAAYKGSK